MPEAALTIEERVAALEHEISDIKDRLKASRETSQQPWWERLAGTFENDPMFEEIVEAGHTYRRSLEPDET
jgi:hypothetical protein